MIGRVLITAGSDSGGGAGVQADIKTVTMLGGYAATAITALTAQNTLGVHAVMPVDPDFVRRQMRVVLADIGADSLKIGMLGRAAVVEAVADEIDQSAPDVPLVLDPVMIAKGGAALLDADAVDLLCRRLLPRAALVTPNLPEAEALTGRAVATAADIEAAGRALIDQGAAAALIKGGHGAGAWVEDWLFTREGAQMFRSPRIATRHTHGTGCTLASAIATGLAQGLALTESVARAIDYVAAAIRAAPGLGQGHGPLGHGEARVDPVDSSHRA